MNERQLPGWFATDANRLFHWYLESEESARALVVLIPPLGHEAFHSHRFYRLLADECQRNGFDVIRFDLPGHGDSTGDLADPACHVSWLSDIQQLIQHYRQDRPLIVGGLRFGANLASMIQADHYLLIEPVLSPKRYVREISVSARIGASDSGDSIGVESGGYTYTQALLDWIKSSDTQFASGQASGQIILSQPDRLKSAFGNLPSLEVDSATGLDGLLAEPQYSDIPDGLFGQVLGPLLDWPAHMAPVNLPAPDRAIEETEWTESCYQDSIGQFGILCEPSECQHNNVLVFLNSGSGPHTGPNRLYVELCRTLATHGIRTLRVDIKNLGDSANIETEQENHCYPHRATEYCNALLTDLSEHEWAQHISLAGICSGAHHAFHSGVAGHPKLSQLILINPLTFYWHEGMSLATPTEQQVTVDSHYYARTLRSGAAWKKLFSGKVDYSYIAKFAFRFGIKKAGASIGALKRLVAPVPANQFTRDLAVLKQRGIETSLIIAEYDPGWGLLNDASQMKPSSVFARFPVKGLTIPKANHTFSKRSTRPLLVEALVSSLQQAEVSP
ncbi:alpha/beta hydrolase [Reinekea blandensis]|uniref:AB hydrolase-1 domain-containing protein n=1 Tax=Reinekea blandensis MED297 TaxID=314283 RepID=A4B961_9GAMM|nr:alpha/beta fold hydrolase [Reinekea blandensis]EAR11162.1 hypothetical protein MED297_19782 [Reinekea sp. MED297] [Reinekea blandensis MED297]